MAAPQRSRALKSLSSIVDRGPITRAESDRLLNRLRQSFRATLDQAHPHAGQGHGKVAADSKLYSSHTVASSHFGTILTSPLFSAPRPHGQPELPTGSTAWFLDHVARGTADLSLASRYLSSEYQKALRLASTTGKSSRMLLRESAAGSHVLSWLYQCGLAADGTFLKMEYFTRKLVYCLLAESRDEIVWNWIRRRTPNASEASAWQPGNRARMLLAMLRFKLTGDGSGEEVLRDLLSVISFSHGRITFLGDELWHLRHCCYYLLNNIVTGRLVLRDSSLYETTTEVFSHVWSLPSQLPVQSLALHYKGVPARTRASEALAYMESAAFTTGIVEAKAGSRKYFSTADYVSYCLDVAKLLLLVHDEAQADRVMQFTKENFREELGLEKLEKEEEMQEMENVKLLDSLILE